MKQDTLIIGAGVGAEQILREIRDIPSIANRILGILDDDPEKKGEKLFDYPVIGEIRDLKLIAAENKIRHVYIAIPSATSSLIRGIIYDCASLGITPKILPNLREILSNIFDNRVHYSNLRPVAMEDLMGREEVKFQGDPGQLEKLIYKKNVLITGAGGSIGTEICQQVIKFGPGKIILLDHNEYFLFLISEKLRKLISQNQMGQVEIIPILGDIRHRLKLEHIFHSYSIDLIFHAAAYKHVPLLEKDPWEAISNNVLGTLRLLQSAFENKVDRVVMISTDKAIRPAGVMGASKRLAELISQSLYQFYREEQSCFTRLLTVRFGNVMGSKGSVLPVFEEQIRNGGPLQVTDPKVTRFFMSIQEAVGLVLEVASIGQSNEIYILDMGKAISILDLARDLIALHGLELEKDIQIEFTGLRPGEKLHEDIQSVFEDALPTHHEKIRIYLAQHVNASFWQEIEQWIESLSFSMSQEEILQQLQRYVTDYSPAVRSLK